MRKKLSTLALLLLVAAGSVHAYDFSAVTSSGHTLYYNIVSGGAEVTYPNSHITPWGSYTKPTGALVIDSTVNHGGTTYSVTSIGDYAFRECTGLTSVTIPNSVTSIGNYAFYGCTGLTSVTIPNSVTSIGNQAFFGCTGLTSVTIPNSVTSIGNSAFYGCTGLTSVTIPNSVTSIGSSAFGGCTGLTSIVVANGNSVYDSRNNCNAIIETNNNRLRTGCQNTIIPNSVTFIGYDAFYQCTGLTSVTIPNSVFSIEYGAFYGCTGLTSVTIPNSVTSIGDKAFASCTGLTSIVVANGNSFYDSRNNCNAIIETNTNTLHTGCQNTIIPNSVTSIGNYAFSGCTGLTSVTIPNSVTSIGTAAFSGCTGLTSVTIPNSVTSIGYWAFQGCTGLTSVSLGEGVVNIGSLAFLDCGIIGELVIPQSVTTIGDGGFRNCYGVNEITCLGRVAPSLGGFVFDGLDTSITVNIPCGTTDLYAGCWPYFHNFNEIPFLFKVATDNPAQGTAQMVQEPSCDDPVAIVQATARNGYHFDHWSDGSTQNPYTCVVTGSMTLTAFFASDSGPIGIEDVYNQGIKVYADGSRIVVTGAEEGEACLYDMMGRLAAKGHVENGSITFDAPAAGVYIVRIGDYPARRVVIVR